MSFTPASQTKIPEGKAVTFWSRFIATGAFVGYIPWASGTFGTLVGLLIYLIPGMENPALLFVVIFVGLASGVYTSAKVAPVEGHRLTKTAERAKAMFQHGTHSTPDPSIIVIDEIVGIWIALLFIPKTLAAIVICFILFRLFDIIKPYPAKQLEHIPNGWGIMLDDVVAGIYANIATQVLYRLLMSLGFTPYL
ncbi:MAG: phosphatidylglycerophosphatase A [Bacteroidota bacterium]